MKSNEIRGVPGDIRQKRYSLDNIGLKGVRDGILKDHIIFTGD